MAPSWVISKSRNVVAVLSPNFKEKKFDIQVKSGVSDGEMAAAVLGTVRDNRLVYVLDGEEYSTPIRSIRQDRRDADGRTVNSLRHWEKLEFIPQPTDIFGEKLYCIQWIASDSLDKARTETFFASVAPADLAREEAVQEIVRIDIERWQQQGLLADMQIVTGKENEGPIRTNGWTYRHH